MVKVSYPVYSVAFTPGKPRLLVGGGGGASNKNGVPNSVSGFKVESSGEGHELQTKLFVENTFPIEADTCMSIAVHPKEKIAAAGVVAPSASNSAVESVLKSSPSKALDILRGRGKGSKAVNAGEKHNVAILEFKKNGDAETLEPLVTLASSDEVNTENHYVKRLSFSDDGRLLMAGCANGTVVVWGYNNGSFVDKVYERTLNDELQDADLNSHLQILASCTADNLHVASVDNVAGKSDKCNVDIRAPVYRHSLSCSFRACRFLPIKSGKSGQEFVVHTAKLLVFVNSSLKSGPKRSHVMCFLIQQQPDSASGGSKCVAQEFRTSRQLGNQLVSAVAVCAETGIFGAAFSDFSIGVFKTDAHYSCLWKVARGHTFVITSLSFSSGGSLLASGSADGTFGVWTVGKTSTSRCLQWSIWLFILLSSLLLVLAAVILSNEDYTFAVKQLYKQALAELEGGAYIAVRRAEEL